MKHKISTIVWVNIAGVLLLVAAIELTTRTVSWFQGDGFALGLHELQPTDDAVKSIYTWHPFTGFTYKSDSTIYGGHRNQRHQSELRVDRHGFLSSDDIAYEKADNELRIATIGGSTTAGINLNFDENWPGYLRGLLQEELENRKVTMINAAVPGYDTSQSIGNLALRVMPLKPDIVIIYHAYNDLKAIRPALEFKPDYSHIHDTPYGHHEEPNALIKLANNSMFYVRMRNRMQQRAAMERVLSAEDRASEIPELARTTFEQHMRSLVAIASNGGAKVVLVTFVSLFDVDKDWARNETIHSLPNSKRVELLLMMNFTPGLTIQGIMQGLREYNETIRKVAAEEGAALVDMAAGYPHTERNFVDRVHFSVAGAKLFASRAFPIVRDCCLPADLPDVAHAIAGN